MEGLTLNQNQTNLFGNSSNRNLSPSSFPDYTFFIYLMVNKMDVIKSIKVILNPWKTNFYPI